MNGILLVLRHELLLQRKQPMMLLMLLLMGLGIGPLGLLGMNRYVGELEQRAEKQATVKRYAIDADATFAGWVVDEDKLDVREGRLTTDDQLDDDEVLARVRVKGTQIVVEHSMKVSKALSASSRVSKVVDRVNRKHRQEALEAVGESLDDFEVDVKGIGRDDARTAGDLAGRTLPGMVLFLLMMVAMYGAFDVFTKEKEKGTAETLLSTAIPRQSLLLGKFALVWLLTFAVGSVWTGSLFFTEAAGLLELPGVFAGQVFTLTNTAGLLIGVLLWSLQITAVAVALGAWASSFREASVGSIPVLFSLFVPVGVAASPTTELTPLTLLLPLANTALGVRGLMGGELTVGWAVAVLVATLIETGLVLAFTLWLLQGTEPLDVGLDAEARRAGGDFGQDALVVALVGLAMFFLLGSVVQAVDIAAGVVVSLGGLAVWGVVAARFFGAPLQKTFSGRLPSARNLGLAVVGGLTLHGVGILASQISDLVAPTPDAVAEMLLLFTGYPWWVMVLIGAVTPGIFEEIFFRGALLGMLRTRYSTTASVVISSVVFGVFHGDLSRFLYTTLMGVVLALITIRSRSLLPSMVAHTLNNALAFSLMEPGTEDPATWVLLPWSIAMCAILTVSVRSMRATDTAEPTIT